MVASTVPDTDDILAPHTPNSCGANPSPHSPAIHSPTAFSSASTQSYTEIVGGGPLNTDSGQTLCPPVHRHRVRPIGYPRGAVPGRPALGQNQVRGPGKIVVAVEGEAAGLELEAGDQNAAR